MRLKIDYGIDLGTTNSSICRMEQGRPVILRTETLREVMPSCVSFTRRKSIKVGDSAFNDLKQDKRRATHSWKPASTNTFQEFKRTMGTNTLYHSDNMGRDYSSVDLSAEVLRQLRTFVTDEQPTSIVVTVPAKFTVNQKTATLQAANEAGFTQCELLQEPIAAAMAYGLSASEKDGCWLVFDFGGGTFDAALLRVEDGIIQVADTEGDNYLGGKNLDYALVDRLLMPHLGRNFALQNTLADPKKRELLRDALKTYAEEAKIGLSTKEEVDVLSNLGELGNDDDGEELELDLAITRDEAFAAMRPLIQKAVDICLEVLRRNDIEPSRLGKIILVGGPTRLPLIREMLAQQVSPLVDASIDPMTAVATGAALYASTIDNKGASDSESPNEVHLDIGFEPTTVELTDWVSIKLAGAGDSIGANASERLNAEPAPTFRDIGFKSVMVELTRADHVWSSGRVEVNERGRVVTVQLAPGRPNAFAVSAYDDKGNALPCFPQEFTIIQGTRVGRAVLPYHIGISVWNEQKNDGTFLPFTGLEKNKPLPAVGVVRARQTTSQLRPGVSTDRVVIPVYQADSYQPDSRAYLYEWVADVEITGDEVPSLIPKGSTVEVTLHADASEQMTLEAYFPDTDTTVEKQLDTNRQQSVEEAERRIVTDIDSAYGSLLLLESEGTDTIELRKALAEVEADNKVNTEKKAVLQHLKEVLRRIEALEGSTAWQRVERNLIRELDALRIMQRDFGNKYTEPKARELERQSYEIIRRKDIMASKALIGMIVKQTERLRFFMRLINFINRYDAIFDICKWTNKEKARQMIDHAKEMINEGTTIEWLDGYTDAIWSMYIPEPKPSSSSSSSSSSSTTTTTSSSVPPTINEDKCRGLLK